MGTGSFQAFPEAPTLNQGKWTRPEEVLKFGTQLCSSADLGSILNTTWSPAPQEVIPSKSQQ